MTSLSKFEMEETAVLHLRNAADEPMYADGENGEPDTSKPMRVHVYGPGSKQFQKATAEQNNRFLKRYSRKGKTDRTAEETASDDAAFLVSCTKSFENVDMGGLEGKAFFESVYSNDKLSFIRDQIRDFTKETANFTRGLSKP